MGWTDKNKKSWTTASNSEYETSKRFNHPMIYRMRVVKESKHSEAKVGEIITVAQYATFGCYDEKGRWIDFYCCEIINE